MMFRAATAASGGTGAPDWTYCSIWPWTVFMRASISTPVGATSGSSSTRARRYGLVDTKPVDPEAALPLDDGPHRPVLELDHLGDLGQGADLVELGRRP